MSSFPFANMLLLITKSLLSQFNLRNIPVVDSVNNSSHETRVQLIIHNFYAMFIPQLLQNSWILQCFSNATSLTFDISNNEF